MAEEIQELHIKVKIDPETKKIEIVDQNIKKVEKSLKDTGKTSKSLSTNWKELASAFGLGAIAGMGAVETLKQLIQFTKDAVKSAIDEYKSQKELDVALQTVGQSYKTIGKSLEEYFSSMQAMTRFSDTEMRLALKELIQATGDFDTGLKLLKISMDVASATEQNLTEVANDFGYSLVRQQFGILNLQKRYGDLIGRAKDVNEAINILANRYKDFAITEEGVIKNTIQIRNYFGELKESIGKELLPSFTMLSKWLVTFAKSILQAFQQIGTIMAGVASSVYALFTGNFKGIREIWKGVVDEIVKGHEQIWNISQDTNKKITEITKQTGDLQIKNWQEIRRFIEKADADILKLSKSEYEAKKELLKKEVEEYRKAGVDKVEAEKLNLYERLKLREIELEEEQRRNQVMTEINKLRLEKEKDEVLKNVEALNQSYEADFNNYLMQLEQKKISFDEYWELLEARTQLFYEQQNSLAEEWVGGMKTRYEMLKEMSVETTGILSGAFSDLFMKITNQAEITKISLQKVFNDIANAFVKMLAKMFAEYLAKRIMFALLGGGVGGIVGGAVGGAKKMQEGGIVTRPTLAVLGESGAEAVVPLKKSKEIIGNNINIVIQPFDIRNIDRITIERMVARLRPYLKKELG